jgi:hypothetical protein
MVHLAPLVQLDQLEIPDPRAIQALQDSQETVERLDLLVNQEPVDHLEDQDHLDQLVLVVLLELQVLKEHLDNKEIPVSQARLEILERQEQLVL